MYAKGYVVKFFIGIGFALIIGLYSLYWVWIETHPSMELLYLIGYGGAPLPTQINSYLRSMLLFFVPQIFLVYTLADYMLKDFTICSVYVFTRINARKKWFVKKCIELFFHCSLFYLGQFITIFTIGHIVNLQVLDLNNLIFIVSGELTLFLLTSFIYILLVNVLALKVSVNYSFLLFILFISSSFYWTFVFSNLNIIKYLPVSQSMLIWHDNKILVYYRDLIGNYISGFTIGFSLVYLLIIIATLTLFGIHVIHNLEIMGFEKEG